MLFTASKSDEKQIETKSFSIQNLAFITVKRCNTALQGALGSKQEEQSQPLLIEQFHGGKYPQNDL